MEKEKWNHIVRRLQAGDQNAAGELYAATTIAAASITTAAIVINKNPADPTEPTVAPTYAETPSVSDPAITPDNTDSDTATLLVFTNVSFIDENGDKIVMLTHTFDENGNLTETTNGDLNSSKTTYRYNTNNQLVEEINYSGNSIFSTITYTYHKNGVLKNKKQTLCRRRS